MTGYAVLSWLAVVVAVCGRPGRVERQECLEDCQCEDSLITCINMREKTWLEVVAGLPENSQHLIITNSNFSALTLPKDTQIQPLVHLTHLHLTHSHVKLLGPRAFLPFPHLKELHLVSDEIEELAVESLAMLSQLEFLNLSGNVISELEEETFQTTHNLRILDLAHNHLQILYPRLFSSTPHLQHLNLTKNEVSYIHPGTLTNLTQLRTVHLNHNQLQLLREHTFQDLPSLETLSLQENPWSCDCGLRWLHAHTNITHPLLRKMSPDIRCHTPSMYGNMLLNDIPLHGLPCQEPEILNDLPDLSVKRHDSLVLQCNTSGYPAPSVYWITPRGVLALPQDRKWMSPGIVNASAGHRYAGMPTYHEARLYAGDHGSLLIHHIRHYFAGRYVCVAENPAGVAMASFNVTLVSGLVADIHFSMLVGASTAISFLFICVVFALMRQAVFCRLKRKYKKKQALIRGRAAIEDDEDEDEEEEDLNPDLDYSSWYPSYWSRSYTSPDDSPMKCTTPVEEGMGMYNNPRISIWETLEDTRHRLRQGMERSVSLLRDRAQHVSESGRLYMSNIREHSSHYMATIRESSTHTIHTIRSSSSNYANRFRAGMVLGVEQVKYHVQSMRELCMTGNLGQTISTVSVATNVDSNETYDVVKKITYV